eukprot:SM000068S20547  [mRNA]  locus=s68:84160:84573:- [translate_table: standard]
MVPPSLPPLLPLQAPHLEELHVEYFGHVEEEERFITSLLHGGPRLRKVEKIYSAMAGGPIGTAFYQRMAALRRCYPHVSLPTPAPGSEQRAATAP